jgi:TusE/DsrC/DsvC family sulfur relay protein
MIFEGRFDPFSTGRRMPAFHMDDKTVDVDDHGFLKEPNDWNKEVAEALAEATVLTPLTEDHWRVIMFVREYYLAYETAPMLREISKRTGLGERRVRELFPLSCRECMCRIAGLPRPTG